jgi:hypothetical protein
VLKQNPPLPNIITGPKQFDEFQHLDEMIEILVSHFEHHDIADVFNILFPDSSGNLERNSSGAVKTSNLFYNFTEVSVAQVATSNRWYSEYTDDACDQVHTNLEWSRVYFAKNVDSGLYTIVNDNWATPVYASNARAVLHSSDNSDIPAFDAEEVSD